MDATAAVNAGAGTDLVDNGTLIVYRAGADNLRLSYEANGTEAFLAALGGVTDASIGNLTTADFVFWS